MSKKRRFASATAVLFFFIGLWSMSVLPTGIETNENLDVDVPEDLSVVIEGLDAEKNRTETSQYGAGYGLIQAEHVNIISYPEIKQFHISLTNHSAVPVYGTVSANLGKISKRRIFLESGTCNQITYDAPEGFDVLAFDTITFQFYDGYSRLIDEFKTMISYNEETKQMEAFDYTLSDF